MVKSFAVPTVLGLSGSVWQPSKARTLVEIAGSQVSEKASIAFTVADLAEIRSEPIAYSRSELGEKTGQLLRAITAADALIIGIPVFQGSYPGLFKHIFDLIEPAALKGRPILLSAVGGGTRHALVLEHQLRPLFGFFESNTMPTAVYLCSKDLDENGIQDATTAARLDAATDQLAFFLSPTSSTSRTIQKPELIK